MEDVTQLVEIITGKGPVITLTAVCTYLVTQYLKIRESRRQDRESDRKDRDQFKEETEFLISEMKDQMKSSEEAEKRCEENYSELKTEFDMFKRETHEWMKSVYNNANKKDADE